jgi:hypothetical protein
LLSSRLRSRILSGYAILSRKFCRRQSNSPDIVYLVRAALDHEYRDMRLRHYAKCGHIAAAPSRHAPYQLQQRASCEPVLHFSTQARRIPQHRLQCFLNFMWLLRLQIVRRVVSVGCSFGVCMYLNNVMSATASDTLICDMQSFWWFTPVGDANDAKHQLSRKRTPSSKFLATGERLVRI